MGGGAGVDPTRGDGQDDGAGSTGDSLDDEDEGESCSPAPETFSHALCICEDWVSSGVLAVVPGGHDEDAQVRVGVNGTTNLSGLTNIVGSAVFYGGLTTPAAGFDLDGDLATAGHAEVVGNARVTGNFDVGADLTAAGLLEIKQELRVAGDELLIGGAHNIGARGPYQEPVMPCGCEPEQLLDIEGLVAQAKSDNDNDLIDLSTTVVEVGPRTIHLPTGRYYLESAVLAGVTRLVIEGEVALYVDGTIDFAGVENFDLEEGAKLDLYVSGSLTTVGSLDAGDADRADDLRIFVGGPDAVHIGAGLNTYYGSIYAPRAEIIYAGVTRIVGSIFARRFTDVGNLRIEYVVPGDFGDPDCPGLPPGPVG